MNKRIREYIILLLIGCLLTVCGYAQKAYPEIGKPIPEFTLSKVLNYSKNQLSLEDLKGKHSIFDFWASGCGGCIKAFPKMNALQKMFQQDLQIILVAPQEKWRDIEAFYEVYRKKDDLNLISAFDSTFFKNVVPSGVPHIIWMDDSGIIRAITSTADVNEQNIRRFIRGESFDFVDRSYAALQLDAHEPKVDLAFQRGDTKNVKANFLYRSWLQKWEPGEGRSSPNSIENYLTNYSNRKPQYQAFKITLVQLYSVAYFGKPYNTGDMSRDTTTYYRPTINTKDSALFAYRYPGQPYYNYFLELPGESADANRLRRIMQTDFKNYFGYDAKMVYRDLPCVRLVVIDEERAEKLKTSPGGKLSNQWRDESTSNFFRNQPLNTIVKTLTYKIDGVNSQLAFDNTGITGPVNLDINAHIWDYEGIRKSLREQGLDLIKSIKRMRVLEIKDPEPIDSEVSKVKL